MSDNKRRSVSTLYYTSNRLQQYTPLSIDSNIPHTTESTMVINPLIKTVFKADWSV
jgi:hypothetical protein